MKPFHAPGDTIGDQKADAVARLIAAAVDIAVVIDSDGTIQDLTTTNELPGGKYDHWIGQSWLDVVTVESRKKAKELLKPPKTASLSRWRQLNHPADDQNDLPVRYTSVPLGKSGSVLALGQDLRSQALQQQRLLAAQSAMEREYERLRQSETRYRALFQVSSEAVLIVDANTHRIVEANPSASQLLEDGPKAISGRYLPDMFSAESAPTIIESMSSAASMPHIDGVIVKASRDDRPLSMTTSLVRQNRSNYYIVRLKAQDGSNASIVSSNLLRAVDELPDGLVLVDKDRRIMTCNRAFLELCEIAEVAQVKGEPLDRWLGRVAVDIDVLLAHVRENGYTRRFATLIRGEYGGRTEIEITAVFITDAETPYYALSLRRLELVDASEQRAALELPRSVEELTKLVGRVPLKDLVKETTDIVERLCMEAALDLTRGNRASASEMLGLSRQSFYVKLRRHGLGDLDHEESDVE